MDPVLDDTAPATAETIIHALSQFHTPIEHVSERERDASAEGLESFSRRQLEEEVLRLRGVVQEQPGSHPDASLRASSIQEASSTRSIRPGQPVVPRSSLQADTGKRVEKNRRTELFRAIRCCMRNTMGMANESDPLPAPRMRPGTNADDGEWIVPDWLAPGSQSVSVWMEGIAQHVLGDLRCAHGNPYPKVVQEDRDPQIISDAVKVTFANYVKRYKSENDNIHTARKAKYARKRRRWARKDLKQQRRAKALAALNGAADTAIIDSAAVHFDYMSSEHSSPGSDSSDDDGVWHTEKVKRRAEQWSSSLIGSSYHASSATESRLGKADTATCARHDGEPWPKTYGWASGLAPKVLEVRTPIWRSVQLNETYSRLDSISSSLSESRNAPKSATPRPESLLDGQHSASVKLGHVAPSHDRFTLPPDLRRRGKLPRSVVGTPSKKRRRATGQAVEQIVNTERETGSQDWMWASGTVGTWPTTSLS